MRVAVAGASSGDEARVRTLIFCPDAADVRPFDPDARGEAVPVEDAPLVTSATTSSPPPTRGRSPRRRRRTPVSSPSRWCPSRPPSASGPNAAAAGSCGSVVDFREPSAAAYRAELDASLAFGRGRASPRAVWRKPVHTQLLVVAPQVTLRDVRPVEVGGAR